MAERAKLAEVDLPAAPHSKKAKAKYLALAIFFFILGVIGVIVPVMPQLLFFAASLIFLSMISPPIRRWVRRFLQKHPKMAAQYKKWRDRGRAKRQKLIKKRRALARKLHLKHEQ
ncbi:MAG TPA: DUF454 family protein [Thermoanaerobaculia bacterium]|jgi:uncharacterized membrane protein YbaN (DUF454 family)